MMLINYGWILPLWRVAYYIDIDGLFSSLILTGTSKVSL